MVSMNYYYCYWQTNNNYFVLEDQLPVDVSVTAYARWYSSDTSPVVTILSDEEVSCCCIMGMCIYGNVVWGLQYEGYSDMG